MASALLPPPSSYATVYASYQHEWDAHKHTVPTRSSHNVTAMTWVTADDADDATQFLLVCTDAGEVVTLRLVPNTASSSTTTTATTTSTNSDSSTPPFVLVPHGRTQICGAAVDATEEEEETTTAIPGAFNNKIEIVSLRVHDQKKEQKFVLLAGDRGLWSLPLSALLTGDTTTMTMTTVVHVSDRPIAQVQIVAVSQSATQKTTTTTTSKRKTKKKKNIDDDQYLLYALEQGTNMVLTWNLQTIVEQHSRNDSTNRAGAFLVPETQIDVSRYFSNRKRTRTKESKSTGERATTMFLLKSTLFYSATGVQDAVPSNWSPSNWSLVVGTDRSRLLIVTVKKTEDGTILLEDPRFLSLDEPDGATTKGNTSRPFANYWAVQDLVVHEPWWTVAAHHRDHDRMMTGLLMTWHGPTGMVLSRRETREAIQGLQQPQPPNATAAAAACSRLYSLANEAAVSVWNPLDFDERTTPEKFKVTTPSSTALAVCGPYVAVAGIGNSIDLFLQQCRVQLLRV